MIGKIRKHSTTTESTNLDAREYIRKGAGEGTVVTTDFQTGGRGRRERRWMSAQSESVLASYILYPKRPMDEWGGLPLVAGLSVVEALRDSVGLTAHLKWPNDVLIDRRKICGILVETGSGVSSWAVVGIGINVNQQIFEGDYRHEPTSVFLETKQLSDINTIIEVLSGALDEYYRLWTDMGNRPIIKAWKERSPMMGRNVTIDTGEKIESATAMDLGEDGCLIVRYPDGNTGRVYAGDVTISMEKQ